MAKAKFDIRTEATRPLYAGVGVTDLAVELVREYVADVQKRFAGVQKDVSARIGGLDLEPKALRDQAVVVVSSRVDALSKDAKARRAAIEARVADLQNTAESLPALLQSALNDNAAVVTGTYADLAKRGETLVARIRRQESTKATAAAAKTTAAKAKTTKTQATKATKTTTTAAKKTAKKASTTAKKSSTAPKSSAKATATAAKTTAATAAQATTEAAEKFGD